MPKEHSFTGSLVKERAVRYMKNFTKLENSVCPLLGMEEGEFSEAREYLANLEKEYEEANIEPIYADDDDEYDY